LQRKAVIASANGRRSDRDYCVVTSGSKPLLKFHVALITALDLKAPVNYSIPPPISNILTASNCIDRIDSV
jgi:hypothetical protein